MTYCLMRVLNHRILLSVKKYRVLKHLLGPNDSLRLNIKKRVNDQPYENISL